MREQPYEGGSLFGPSGSRKYLNSAERQRFIASAQHAPPMVRLFYLVLRWSGGRISEVLALTPAAIDIDSGVVNLETLKRRKRGVVRQLPLPPHLLREQSLFRIAPPATRRATCREAFGVGSHDGSGR